MKKLPFQDKSAFIKTISTFLVVVLVFSLMFTPVRVEAQRGVLQMMWQWSGIGAGYTFIQAWRETESWTEFGQAISGAYTNSWRELQTDMGVLLQMIEGNARPQDIIDRADWVIDRASGNIEETRRNIEEYRTAINETTNPEEIAELERLITDAEEYIERTERLISEAQTVAANATRENRESIRGGIDDMSEMKKECRFGMNFSLVECMKEGLAWLVALIIWLLSWLVWLVGQLFNYSVKISILDFKTLADMEFVRLGWTITRDLANIGFIFLLLYIAFSTILRLSSANTTRLLGIVIITALFVNFSAFLTRTAIDVSNTVAVVFYNNMGNRQQGETLDVSQMFLTRVGPKYFTASEPEREFDAAKPSDFPDTWTGIILNGLGRIILIVLAILVILAAAALFLIRSLVLLILIITAPIAFLGFALAAFGKNITGEWGRNLSAQLLFAPAFMAMFYITLKMVDSSEDIQRTMAEGNEFIGGIILYLFLIGMMMASIMIASKVGATGGQWANKFSVDRAKGWGSKIGWGVAGAAGTQTIGRAANKFATSETAQNLASRYKLARGVQSAANVAAGAKFGGGKSFREKQEAVQKRSKDFDTPEQKERYLLGQTSANQKKIYEDQMSDQQRANAEIEAITRGDQKTAQVYKALREGMSLDQQEKIGEAMERKLKTDYGKQNTNEERIAHFTSLNEDLQRRLYKSMSPDDRAFMENAIDERVSGYIDSRSRPPELLAVERNIEEFKQSLNEEDRNKTNKALGELRDKTANQEIVRNLEQIHQDLTLGNRSRVGEIQNLMDRLSIDQVSKMNNDILMNPEMIIHMEAPMVEKIFKEKPQGVTRTVAEEIQRNGTESARRYIEGTPYAPARQQTETAGASEAPQIEMPENYREDSDEETNAQREELRAQIVRERQQNRRNDN